MNTEEKKKKLREYIKTKKSIETALGNLTFTNSNALGEGGNGLVYLSEINEKEIAIKFLITDSERKCTRFKSEYFNTNYVRDELCNIVNMIYYGEFQIEDETIIPYIIMSPYAKNLMKYRKEKDEVQEEDFKKLIEFLLTTLKSIHKKNIIHRDIKPENILVDEDEKFVLADFGIAHYKRDDFLIDNKTEKKERLANVSFSAPEQIINGYEVTQTADIYSMAQIMYWFIFKSVSRGTGKQKIAKKYNKWKDADIYDIIIDKCLRDNPNERFQSIEEIDKFYENKKNEIRIINPFQDMLKFHDAIVSVVPEFFNSVDNITDKGVMSELFNSIFSCKYNEALCFNTGIGNNSISSIIKLENDDFLMEGRQLNIRKVWGFLNNSLYDDILLLEIDNSSPYKIEGKEYYHVAVIKNEDGKEDIVPYEKISSGYIRYNDKVHKISDLTIQERKICNDYKVIVIAPSHNCTIIPENDKFLEELQYIKELEQEDIRKLKRKIYKNKTKEVLIRL